MKKIYLLIVVCSIIIGYNINNNLKVEPQRDSFEYYSILSGYISNINSDDKKIISNYSDFKDYCSKYNENGKLDNLIEKYDNNYFKNESLAIVYLELSSGSAGVGITNASRNLNSVIIEYYTDYPKDGMCGTNDMSGELMIVEIDKDINSLQLIKKM